MAIYRKIHLSYWTDPKVDDDFTPEDKYFYLYLLTNPHTNICGCYELGEKQCSRETGYNQETVSRLLKRFEEIHDVIRYNTSTKEVLLLNWYKYNWTTSKDLLKNVNEVAQTIKCDEFREYIISLANSDSETVHTPSPHPVGTSVTVTDTVTDTVSVKRISKSKKEVFKAPTLEEIQEYVKERNSPVDPKAFYDYYSAGEWKDSKGNPVKNWKQKLITWEKGDNNGRSKSVHENNSGHSKEPVKDYSYLYSN